MSEYKRSDSDVIGLMSWIIRTGGTLAALGVIVGALSWGADTRYAQKAEVRVVVQKAVDGLRGASIEDKIFEINLIPLDKRTDVQRALLDRYLREAEALKSKRQ